MHGHANSKWQSQESNPGLSRFHNSCLGPVHGASSQGIHMLTAVTSLGLVEIWGSLTTAPQGALSPGLSCHGLTSYQRCTPLNSVGNILPVLLGDFYKSHFVTSPIGTLQSWSFSQPEMGLCSVCLRSVAVQ